VVVATAIGQQMEEYTEFLERYKLEVKFFDLKEIVVRTKLKYLKSKDKKDAARLEAAKAQYQAGLGTPLEDLYAPEAPEAMVLCQAGLMMASESCLPAPEADMGRVRLNLELCLSPLGHAAPGEAPEADKGQVGMASKESCLPPPGGAAAQYQAGLGMPLEDLYAPEAAEAVVLCQARQMVPSDLCGADMGQVVVASESCLSPPGHAAPGEAPEADMGQVGMASKESCLSPPGHAAPGEAPEADMGQVGMASKESCLPPPEGAAAQYQAGLGTPLEDLYAPEAVEAVVLCQAGLMVASESCLPVLESSRLDLSNCTHAAVPRLTKPTRPICNLGT
jgi:hypothetical protein